MSLDDDDKPYARTTLSLWDTTSLMLGIIVGVGIFVLPSIVFNNTFAPWQTFTLWVLGGLLALVGALCFGELASTYPRSGGEYVYLTRAFGSLPGFLFAWSQLVIIRAGGSVGPIAYAFAEYSGRFFEIDQGRAIYNAVMAVSVIIVLTVVNILGVRFGKRTQNVLTLLKVAAIAGLLATGFLFGEYRSPTTLTHRGHVVEAAGDTIMIRQSDDSTLSLKVNDQTKLIIDGNAKNKDDKPFHVTDFQPGQRIRIIAKEKTPQIAQEVKVFTGPQMGLLVVAMVLVMWTYSGWHEAGYVVSEVKDKQKTMPRALLLGTGSVMILYLAINAAYLAGLGFERAGESRTIAADVLDLAFGEWAGKAMALVVMISCLGAVNGLIFTSSRIFAEMGKDHVLFAPLAQWHANFGTPVISLLVQCVLSCSFVIFVIIMFWGEDPFETLTVTTAAVFWLFFLLTGLALFTLRSRDAQLPRPFRVPLYPITPIVFCLSCGFMAYSSVTYRPYHSLVGLALLVLGVPFFFISQWKRSRQLGPDMYRTSNGR